jgi:GntR family transcriptional regulator
MDGKEEEMNLWIDNKSGVPIYEQIYKQIKGQIMSGELKENTPLPSIRNLAKDLRISVITTKRAYDELEQAGFVYTVPAKGCFVAPRNVELLRGENLRRIEEHLCEAIDLARGAQISREELIEMLNIYYGEVKQ